MISAHTKILTVTVLGIILFSCAPTQPTTKDFSRFNKSNEDSDTVSSDGSKNPTMDTKDVSKEPVGNYSIAENNTYIADESETIATSPLALEVDSQVLPPECDPAIMPPNYIFTSRACRPYVEYILPWVGAHIYNVRIPGHRIKQHVGKRSADDDDFYRDPFR